MASLKPYRLTILLSPQASKDERAAVESLVAAWAREQGGEVRPRPAEEKRRLSYNVGGQPQATLIQLGLTALPEKAEELRARLQREKQVLRFRLFSGKVAEGKRIGEIPVRKGDVAGRKSDLKTAPVKVKAPIEKLEEKIDEILKEEVL